MLEIGLATESKQQEVLDTSLSVQKTVEDIKKATAKPTTLLSVKNGGISTNTTSPDSLVLLFASPKLTNNLMGHTVVKPVSSTDAYINPYTQAYATNTKLSNQPYFNSISASRIYKDGIMLVVGRGCSTNSASGTYYYTFSIYKVRGFNDKGLPLYELLGSTNNIVTQSSEYKVICNFFRKGDKVALLYGSRPQGDNYRMTLNNLKMLQFDLTTKTMTTGSVSLSGITGLVTSSVFYFPTPPYGTINDIDYGHLMYYANYHSSYGRIKYRAEFDPDTTSIIFKGKWEAYSTATESYYIPIDASPYPVISVSYISSTDRLLYETIYHGAVYYGYNYAGSSPTAVKLVTTPEGLGGMLEPGIFEEVPFAYFELREGLAIYKLNLSNNKYEYVSTISTKQFTDATYRYPSYGLCHFGMVVAYLRTEGGTNYYDYSYVDYTKELRELLGIGG